MSGSKSQEVGDYPSLRALLIDDEAIEWQLLLEMPLHDFGIELVVEPVPENALSLIDTEEPDVLLLDVLFPGQGGGQDPIGQELLKEIVATYPELPVVMFTTTLADGASGFESNDFPGAAFIFSKSIFHDEWTDQSDPYHELCQCLKQAVLYSKERKYVDKQLGFIVGNTQPMRELVDKLHKVAATNLPVLISGESGTGKELIASSLHRLSARKKNPFVRINCGAMSDETLESTLFGHGKGAFTGAVENRKGLFAEADGGTLFLDEVQTMSPRLQQSLLRALQDSVIRRLGEDSEFTVDVRIVAATNEDLEERVGQGTFRADLYYRLNRTRMNVPSLRDRRSDIVEFYAHFIGRANQSFGKSVSTTCREDLRELLESNNWPGNIRELQSAIETAVALSKSNLLTPSDFPDYSIVPQEAGDLAGRRKIQAEHNEGRAYSLTWAELRDIKGAQRRVLLLEVILEKQQQIGRRPTSAEIAETLGTSTGNVRRILYESGIKLRDLG